MHKASYKNILKAALLAAVQSWWLIGALGWAVIAVSYPIDIVLPTYAE